MPSNNEVGLNQVGSMDNIGNPSINPDTPQSEPPPPEGLIKAEHQGFIPKHTKKIGKITLYEKEQKEVLKPSPSAAKPEEVLTDDDKPQNLRSNIQTMNPNYRPIHLMDRAGKQVLSTQYIQEKYRSDITWNKLSESQRRNVVDRIYDEQFDGLLEHQRPNKREFIQKYMEKIHKDTIVNPHGMTEWYKTARYQTSAAGRSRNYKATGDITSRGKYSDLRRGIAIQEKYYEERDARKAAYKKIKEQGLTDISDFNIWERHTYYNPVRQYDIKKYGWDHRGKMFIKVHDPFKNTKMKGIDHARTAKRKLEIDRQIRNNAAESFGNAYDPFKKVKEAPSHWQSDQIKAQTRDDMKQRMDERDARLRGYTPSARHQLVVNNVIARNRLQAYENYQKEMEDYEIAVSDYNVNRQKAEGYNRQLANEYELAVSDYNVNRQKMEGLNRQIELDNAIAISDYNVNRQKVEGHNRQVGDYDLLISDYNVNRQKVEGYNRLVGDYDINISDYNVERQKMEGLNRQIKAENEAAEIHNAAIREQQRQYDSYNTVVDKTGLAPAMSYITETLRVDTTKPTIRHEEDFARGAGGALYTTVTDILAIPEMVKSYTERGDFMGAEKFQKQYGVGDIVHYGIMKGQNTLMGTEHDLKKYEGEHGLLSKPGWVGGNILGNVAQYAIPGYNLFKKGSKVAGGAATIARGLFKPSVPQLPAAGSIAARNIPAGVTPSLYGKLARNKIDDLINHVRSPSWDKSTRQMRETAVNRFMNRADDITPPPIFSKTPNNIGPAIMSAPVKPIWHKTTIELGKATMSRYTGKKGGSGGSGIKPPKPPKPPNVSKPSKSHKWDELEKQKSNAGDILSNTGTQSLILKTKNKLKTKTKTKTKITQVTKTTGKLTVNQKAWIKSQSAKTAAKLKASNQALKTKTKTTTKKKKKQDKDTALIAATSTKYYEEYITTPAQMAQKTNQLTLEPAKLVQQYGRPLEVKQTAILEQINKVAIKQELMQPQKQLQDQLTIAPPKQIHVFDDPLKQPQQHIHDEPTPPPRLVIDTPWPEPTLIIDDWPPPVIIPPHTPPPPPPPPSGLYRFNDTKKKKRKKLKGKSNRAFITNQYKDHFAFFTKSKDLQYTGKLKQLSIKSKIRSPLGINPKNKSLYKALT